MRACAVFRVLAFVSKEASEGSSRKSILEDKAR